MIGSLKQANYDEDIEMILPYLYSSFTHELLEGYLKETDISERAATLGIHATPNIVITINIMDQEDEQKLTSYRSLQNFLTYVRQVFKFWQGSLVFAYRTMIVVLLPRDGRNYQMMKTEIEIYTKRLSKLIEQLSKNEYSVVIGVGQYYDNPSQLHLSYQEAERAVKSYILHGKRTIFFDELDDKQNTLTNIGLHNDEQILIEKVVLGDLIGAKKVLTKLIYSFNDLSTEQLSNNLFASFFELLVIVSRAVLTEGVDANEVSQIKEMLAHELVSISTPEQMESWAERMLLLYIELIAERTTDRTYQYVKDAEDYIKRHYANQITLEEVAEKVFVSSSYLSRIFKEQTKESFTQYLNRTRIHHAKKLLTKTQIGMSELALRVGFTNQNYFTMVFRKLEGITPTAFRNKF